MGVFKYNNTFPQPHTSLSHSSTAAPYHRPTPHFLIQVQQLLTTPLSPLSHSSTAAHHCPTSYLFIKVQQPTTAQTSHILNQVQQTTTVLLPTFSFKYSSPPVPTSYFFIQVQQPTTALLPTFSFKYSSSLPPPYSPLSHSSTAAPYHRLTS